MVLTGNDLATLETSICHAINWWKAMKGGSKLRRERLAELGALHAKVSLIGDFAYPYGRSPCEDDSPPDHGDEIIMRADRAAMAKTRRAARAWNRRVGA